MTRGSFLGSPVPWVTFFLVFRCISCPRRVLNCILLGRSIGNRVFGPGFRSEAEPDRGKCFVNGEQKMIFVVPFVAFLFSIFPCRASLSERVFCFLGVRLFVNPILIPFSLSASFAKPHNRRPKQNSESGSDKNVFPIKVDGTCIHNGCKGRYSKRNC